jgi:large subunit ribosomal protein L17
MKKTRKLSRKRDQRQSLLKGLASNLILKGKIKTTEAKAKEMRPFVERLVSKNRNPDMNSARYAAKFLPKAAVQKLMKEIGPKYKERKGGYTRIIKLGQRSSDSAKMATIEFV